MQYFFSRPQIAMELKMKLRMCMTKNIQQTTVMDWHYWYDKVD